MTIEENRPNPDELLSALKLDEEKSKKGKLKIFFGMCAGVGKTYAMLQAAQNEKVKGMDLVIAFVETHNREDTEKLLEGLEIIPRKTYSYKNTELQELDIDAVIQRKPKLAIIDELAHTNAPGSRHTKRFQDVLEILDNGIDVYTTVNVQHLESRSETVTQITGVPVRETLPDDIFEKADFLELVDITPDELLQRFSEGKIYTPERSREAIQNFFRKGNITALREMALRIMADRVDKQLHQYMQQKRIPGPWKSGLHLMAVIGPSPYSAKLLRWAKNLSYTMGATLLALHVESSRKLSDSQQQQLTKNINLARQLGAEFLSTSGDDIVKAILNIAQKENITHIIIGKSRKRTFLQLFLLGNFVNRLIRHSGNIDVYVVGSDLLSDIKYKKYISLPAFSSDLSHYVSAVLVIIITALCFYPLHNIIGYQIVAFTLLFTVSILAIFYGIGPILVAATLSALLWDFFFIPPSFTLHIGKPEDVMILLMYFIIALLNGVLTSRVRRQERLTRDREERTNALFQLTKKLSLASGVTEILKISDNAIERYFHFSCTFILQNGNNELSQDYKETAHSHLSGSELSIATWAFQHSDVAGKFTDTLPSTDLTFYPLNGARLRLGVAAIKHEKAFTHDEELFWDNFKTQIINALEREFLNEMALKASILNESDKLYKTLFNSISHELRIPIATIMGASDSLLSTEFDKKTSSSLCTEIYTASRRLNRLIENLLNMSRLESGRITPRLDWYDVHDLAYTVTENLKNELQNFTVEIVIPEDMPLVKFDFGLIEQVLHNLVFNSTQHAPEQSTIRIKMYYDKPNFVMQVMDRGTGFPSETLPFVLNKFYRLESSKTGGTGLGLSIVKGFVEAHNGTVQIKNRQHGGAVITVKIPSDLPEFNLNKQDE